MRQYFFIAIFFFCYFGSLAQKTIEKTLERFNNGTVPYITVEELKNGSDVILLDTRKKEEFAVSHLKNAQWAGFKDFDIQKIRQKIPNTDTAIVVYCSIGVRSEKIGEKLQKAGYANIKNLYGGIFEWKNQGHDVVDSLNITTERIHAFSKHWGKLLTKGVKVYPSKQKQLENQY
jgi:rhodanese-related sulfurtransferase